MILEVDTPYLKATIDGMKLELNNMIGIAKELYSVLDELECMWEGLAHNVFMSQYSSDQQILFDMCNAIELLIEDIDEARVVYEKCEQSVKDEIKKI